MKIICVDNFDRETISDKLVAENLSNYDARHIVKLLNEAECDEAGCSSSENYYKAVEDDHKLYEVEY